MFNGASSFNQNLCAWRDSFPYGFASSNDIFANLGCTFQNRPWLSNNNDGPFCASDCSPIVSCSAQYILICIFEPCKLIFISLLLTGESTRRFYFSWAWSQITRYCWWSIYWWCFWGLRNWQFVFHNQWFLGDSHHFCWTMCIHVTCLEDDVWI